MTPGEIINHLNNAKIILASKNDEFIKLNEKRAISERDYNIEVARKTLDFKSDGYAIGIINTLVKGDKVVAELKLKLDIADGILSACRESMRDIRTEIDSLRSVLSWLKMEYERQ